MTLSAEKFIETALHNPVNAALLSRLPSLGLGQCHLTAGCVLQATWNQISGRSAEWGVKDYDVFYFDEDLSGALAVADRRSALIFLRHAACQSPVNSSYSGTSSPDPPNSAGKSLSFGNPSRMGRTVSAQFTCTPGMNFSVGSVAA